MKLIWKYLKEYRKMLVGVMLLAVTNQVFALLDPQIFRLLVDNYASRPDELARDDFLRGIILLLLAFIGVALVSRVARTLQDYYLNVVTEKMGTSLYAHAVQHTLSLPYAVFEDQRSGEILLKMEKARDDAKKLVTSSVSVLFLSLIGIMFVLIYSYMVHWMIGTVFIVLIPLLIFVIYFISKDIKEAQKHIVIEQAGLAGATTETLRNVELVKSLGLAEQEIVRLNKVNDTVLKLELKKVKLIRRLGFIQGTLINFLRSILMFLMLWLIYAGDITLGEFFSLLFYSFFIFNPLGEFGRVVAEYREAQASMHKLSEILDRPVEKKTSHLQIVKGLKEIKFEDVALLYSSRQDPSVKNMNLTICAGQTIAFVGPSGSGKSTLIKLLVGLYKPTNGVLSYNGVAADQINFDELKQRIGLVSQETQLFTGSIRENLLFVKPDATDQECLRAIQSAQANQIIERGGKGLSTKIGEGGIKLSGGERQRLAIARALLRKPELFIFDEATSSLDSITEKEIIKTIKKIENENADLMKILVAHRLSTIMHADLIYVLQNGKIIESGTHEELISDGKLYAAMWQQQKSSA